MAVLTVGAVRKGKEAQTSTVGQSGSSLSWDRGHYVPEEEREKPLWQPINYIQGNCHVVLIAVHYAYENIIIALVLSGTD